MSVTVLGIDIAKQKFDVALLLDGKTKHKTCKNSAEGFESLWKVQWQKLSVLLLLSLTLEPLSRSIHIGKPFE